MATQPPNENAAELQETTKALGALSLYNETQAASQDEPELDSDGEEELQESDAQRNESREESANNNNVAPPDPLKTVPLPFTLFVYGPLADPFFLTYTIKMGTNPELTRSSISGYRFKFYRHYPAPILAQGKTISEFSIQVQNETQLRKITKWYATSYKMIDCKIEIMRKEGQDYATSTKDWMPSRWVRDRVVNGKVFVWAGDVESKELKEGHWDEGWWEMERDMIMGIKKKTNTRQLDTWEVKQKSRFDIWEDERKEERLKLRRAEEAKAKKSKPRKDEQRREGELGNLD
jgi:hypothetical protein